MNERIINLILSLPALIASRVRIPREDFSSAVNCVRRYLEATDDDFTPDVPISGYTLGDEGEMNKCVAWLRKGVEQKNTWAEDSVLRHLGNDLQEWVDGGSIVDNHPWANERSLRCEGEYCRRVIIRGMGEDTQVNYVRCRARVTHADQKDIKDKRNLRALRKYKKEMHAVA